MPAKKSQFKTETATADFTLSQTPEAPAGPSSVSGQGASELAESRFAPGTVLAGRYRIVTALGSGGMGEVYRADDLKLDQKVALKFLPEAKQEDANRRALLIEEVKNARQISHPNVCRVHDVGEVEGLIFISMEYIDGEDLASLLLRIGRLPAAKAFEIGRQMASGLAAAHERGLLHRDLKPANLMIDGEGRARIADFGLAAISDDVRGAAVSQGTPLYMAPEQLAGREVSVHSDLYALGLVLYELFTGRRAFEATSRARSLAEITELRREAPAAAPSTLVEGLDPSVERLILSCLEEDPARRPASAEEVAAALAAGEGATEETRLATLLVSDLVAGAELDDETRQLHDGLVRGLLERHSGREIDASGGFLLLFETPWEAVRYALAYHQALLKEGVGLEARVGIHLGEVVLRRNPPQAVEGGARPFEVEGEAGPTAGRLRSLARARQTLLTRSAFDLARAGAVAEAGAELCWLAHGRYLLKGFGKEPFEVFEVGEADVAPQTAPDSVEEAIRQLGEETILGWRPAPGLEIPQRPNWAVERKLGEGGFGEVWLAAHRKTRDRRVFKFCYEAERLRSLKREITLVRLLKEELGDRDDIARILDWNLDEAPYFIESVYTEGGSLVEWAEAQGGIAEVSLAERLEIVAQVAEALAAAHSVGVLHKDVKPANVLITTDREGRPRAVLTDFGIGLITDREKLQSLGITALGLTEVKSPTEDGASTAGTRLYLAPELLEGKASTVQADVYALGVMLYQMAAGDFSRALAPGWERDVDDELLREDIAWAVDRSASRRLGNVQRIADRLQSLESRRQERAAEARERREAKQAREALASTRKRRKLVSAVMAALAIIAAVTAFQGLRIARERDRADREAVRANSEAVRANSEALAAREVSEHLVEIFQLAQAEQARGTEITVREILDRGTERLERELSSQPAKQARLMNTLGRVYKGMGLLPAATRLVEKALEIRRELHGDEHLEVAESEHLLAELDSEKGDWEAAEPLFRQALATRRLLLGDEHPDVASSLHGLAFLFDRQGDLEAAEPLFHESLAMRRKLLGDQHPDVATSLNKLGGLLLFHGKYTAAEPLLRESLAIRRELLGDEHLGVCNSLNHLGLALLLKGEPGDAEPLHREALATRRKLLGDDHPMVTESLNNLATARSMQGDYLAAEQLHREALAIKRRLFGDEHPRVAITLNNLARVFVEGGDPGAAEAVIREALDVFRRTLPAGHFRIANAESVLGSCLTGLGRHAEAERLLLASYPIIAEKTGERSRYTRDALERSVALYEAWGKPEKAAEVRALLAAGGQRAGAVRTKTG